MSWINFDYFNYMLIIFDTNFSSMRAQIYVSTPTLQINTTLVSYRDSLWCTQPQLTGRIWLCVQYWSPGEPKPILGTLFENIYCKCWNEIMFVFTLFMIPNLIRWTLILLVCWHACYGGPWNGHTMTLHKNSLRNCHRFHEHLRNYVIEITLCIATK